MNITPIPAFSDNYIWMIFHEGRAAIVDPGDPAPVLTALEDQALSLDTIIITHHHFDHTGGVAALKSATGCRVIGPDNPKIGDIDYTMVEGAQVTVLGHGFEVMEVPGHTLDHIAYYIAEKRTLFCGDTLFVGGCGRVFEGTFPMMQQSLAKLSDLPSETQVYCTHEYTLKNLEFLKNYFKDNTFYENKYQNLSKSMITLPSLLKDELESNPFLNSSYEEFKKLREAKDLF